MTLKDKLNNLMGSWEDKRGPSTCFAPWAAKCPVIDCEDRGNYTNCYLESNMSECHIYNKFISNQSTEHQHI